MSSLSESKAQMAVTGSLGTCPWWCCLVADVSRLPVSFPVEQIQRTFQDLQVELQGYPPKHTYRVRYLRPLYPNDGSG